MSGTRPEPPAASSTGVPASRSGDQTNHPPTGPRSSIASPTANTSVRYVETSPPGTRWTVTSTRAGATPSGAAPCGTAGGSPGEGSSSGRGVRVAALPIE
ncbi:MAG: hypothetical protein ACTMID_13705 [Cellulosimicrobium funkei]